MVHLHCGFAVPGEIKQHTPKQMTWNVTAKAGELDGPSWPNVAEVPAKSAEVHQSQQGVRRSGVDEEVDYATERTSESLTPQVKNGPSSLASPTMRIACPTN